MFFRRPSLTVRPAGPNDRSIITSLTRFEQRVHTHLDWKPPEDWLSQQPFLLAERGTRVLGTLACPPDPENTAWLRLFALAENAQAEEVWEMLWPVARAELEDRGTQWAAGVSLDGWMDPLYRAGGFEHTHSVVVLVRAQGPTLSHPSIATIRPARPGDWSVIATVDTAAFSPPWQMSTDLARFAIRQADYLTVAEIEDEVVGYQLTTLGHTGAHLARLAVLPQRQGKGIGAALVADLIEYYQRRNVHEITVNTQDSNVASLAVYQKWGFVLTGARYPVFQLALKPGV